MNPNSLAKALSGNLTYSDLEDDIRPIDKLRAMALGSIGPGRESHLNSLGISLIAFKHAHRADYYLQAVRQLGFALGWRKVKNRGAVSRQSITEWVVDVCPACWNAREIFAGDLMRPCMVCAQTGKRRYSDEERKGIPGKAMSEAHSLISLAVSVAVRAATKRLSHQGPEEGCLGSQP